MRRKRMDPNACRDLSMINILSPYDKMNYLYCEEFNKYCWIEDKYECLEVINAHQDKDLITITFDKKNKSIVLKLNLEDFNIKDIE